MGDGVMRRALRLIGRLLLVGVVLVAIAVVFRQGWIPPRYTPLPRLDIDNPIPIGLVNDWQLAELRKDRALCESVIGASKTLVARMVPDQPLKNGCGWVNAVHATSFGKASFTAARMTCPVAAAMALWVNNEVQPLAQRIFGQPVVRMDNMGVYSCRNIIGSRFWKHRRSEHATANAVDIGGFRLADGTHISVLRDWRRPGKKSEFLRAVHRGGCRYFRVSLGPDFNAAHRNHFHFDRGILYTCH